MTPPTGEKGMKWQKIDTAPKDGTVVRLRNPQIAKWEQGYVDGKWGIYLCPFNGKESHEWILVKDYEQFMPCRPGTFICPDEWMPLPQPPSQEEP